MSGYSGIGKSSLVAELHRPIVRERGFFLSGKFDQLQADIPYPSFIQAFRGFRRSSSARARSSSSAGGSVSARPLAPNGRLIVDVIPELELILGPQPPVPELPPAEAQNRLHVTSSSASSRRSPRRSTPLVLFLDDLQWADAPA